jgi:hydrogenase maturation protease
VVVGVGNALRGDDGVGPEVVRRLRGEPGVELCTGAGLALLDALEGADGALVIDALSSGAPPGTIATFDVSTRPLPGSPAAPARSPGHEIALADSLELARALGRLPRRVLVVGIELERLELGEPLSAALAAALDEVVAVVRRELRALVATI